MMLLATCWKLLTAPRCCEPTCCPTAARPSASTRPRISPKLGIQIAGLASAASNTDVYYAFTDSSNGSLSIVTPTGPLPVVLTSFGVRRLAGAGTAEISWTTATEQNSASFAVERSANPAEGFVAIGQVAAAGTSTICHTYSLRDAAAATQAGVPYYRLRQVDADGHATLSAVAVLAAPVQAGFTLYPNPAPATAQEVTLGTSTALAAGYMVSLYFSGTLVKAMPFRARL